MENLHNLTCTFSYVAYFIGQELVPVTNYRCSWTVRCVSLPCDNCPVYMWRSADCNKGDVKEIVKFFKNTSNSGDDFCCNRYHNNKMFVEITDEITGDWNLLIWDFFRKWVTIFFLPKSKMLRSLTFLVCVSQRTTRHTELNISHLWLICTVK